MIPFQPRLHRCLRPSRVLPVLALTLASFPLASVSSPTVDDVASAIHAGDDARAQELLDTLRAQGMGGVYGVRFLQGVLHLRAGEGEEAVRVFDDLEASEGPAPAIASGQALSAWAAGRHAEARVRLENAVRLWPEDPGVWANLGDIYRALAARAYQQVRRLRRGAGDEAPSPLVPPLPAQSRAPGMPPPSGTSAPASPVPPAAPASAVESAAPADSTVSAELAAPAEPATSTEPAASAAAPVASSDPIAPPSPSPASSFPAPSPGEVASVPLSLPAPAAVASPGSSAVTGCFLAGPWPEAAPPAEVLEWLEAHGASVKTLESASSRYRVYLGPFEDRKRAVQTVVSLKKDLGLRDVAWVPAGPLRDAVSLGVYLKRESVDRRLRELHALGLEPTVLTPRTGAWLRGLTRDFQALTLDWSRTFPDVPLISERCPPSS